MKTALQLLFLIAFFNSFSQDITTDAKANKEETKEYIVRTINEHGFEDNSILNKRYKASFDGNYLNLIVLRKNGKESNDGVLYDFSNVYKFGKVDIRSNKKAFLNIYVSKSYNKKQPKFYKYKLVMEIDDSQIAENLFRALKHYNSLLVAEKTDPRF